MTGKKISKFLIAIVIPGIVLIACIFGFFYAADESPQETYGVFLGTSSSDKKNFDDYDIVVIDPQYYTDKSIEKLRGQGKKIYAYLNIGTVEDFRPYSGKFQDITLDVYDDWPDEKWVDVSEKKWQDYSVNVVADKLNDKGIDGFFIDNTDVYYHYKSDGTYNGLVSILNGLKKYKKDVLINGGNPFVERVISEGDIEQSGITGINQECVFTSIDFESSTFGEQTEAESEYFIEYLDKVNESNLEIYLLEYASPKENALRKKIANYCKTNDYNYYVSSTLDLK